MPTRDTPWPEGTPAWIDVMVDDAATAAEFYGALLGWQGMEPGPPETGGYRIGEVQGKPAAGIMGKQPEMSGMPSVWMTYLAVADLDATNTKIIAAGGKVEMGPHDVMGQGRLGIASDPTGAHFGMWQAQAMIGTQVFNDPGTLVWNECMTRDFDAAKKFYADVFGYSFEDMSSDDMKYATFSVGENMAGGLGGLGDDVPAEVPPHWSVCFAVADTDATLAKAQELGAKVTMPPTDSPYGRYAGLAGPQGEAFAVMGPNRESAG